jgi:hypothetical protein
LDTDGSLFLVLSQCLHLQSPELSGKFGPLSEAREQAAISHVSKRSFRPSALLQKIVPPRQTLL